MAKVKDAETILVGSVVVVEALRDFETKKPDGTAKVTVVTRDAGFAVVKLKAGDVETIKPTVGAQVAWCIRAGHWDRRDSSVMSCVFVRPVTADDLDVAATTLRNGGKAAAAA